jgi:hypothetical protein
LKEWITLDSRNTPTTINLEEEEIVGTPGKDGNSSMPEKVKRPNPWMMMMISILVLSAKWANFSPWIFKGKSFIYNK